MAFDISAIIDKVQHSTQDVDIYLDNSNAARVLELISQIAREEGREVLDRGITDESPLQSLKRELGAIRGNSMTITLRALAQREITILRAKVIKEHPIPSDLSAEERSIYEDERDVQLQFELLSLATVKVINHIDNDAESTSMTPADYEKLCGAIASSQWDALVEGYVIAQQAAKVAAEALTDPTFRGDALTR